MADKFKDFTVGLNSPAVGAVVVVPDDDADLAVPLRGYTVGVGGDVAVIFVDDTVAVVLPARIAGVDYGGRIKKILQTGTTAQGFVGYL